MVLEIQVLVTIKILTNLGTSNKNNNTGNNLFGSTNKSL